MAMKVDPSGSRLPRPTDELFDELADAGWLAFHEQIAELRDPPRDRRAMPLENQSQSMRMGWVAAARAVYAAIAVRGGGVVSRVNDQPADPR